MIAGGFQLSFPGNQHFNWKKNEEKFRMINALKDSDLFPDHQLLRKS